MDKSAVVASAVLVSAMHLLAGNAEIVKRWTNEIQEAVQSKSAMVRPRTAQFAQETQFHQLPAGRLQMLLHGLIMCMPDCALGGTPSAAATIMLVRL